MLAFNAYFDASHHDEPKATVVAGYAAPLRLWESFEIDWRLALARYCVPYFHMKEFIAKQGAFSDPCWQSEARRKEFLTLLIDITKASAMFGVARLLHQSVFDAGDKVYALRGRFNPFSICALDCAQRVRSHIRNLYSDTAPIEYIYDQGDQGKGLLMKEMSKQGLPVPIFRYSKPVKDKSDIVPTIQLQCCDLIAWELRKADVTQDDPAFKGYRKSLKALYAQNTTWKAYKDLGNLCAGA